MVTLGYHRRDEEDYEFDEEDVENYWKMQKEQLEIMEDEISYDTPFVIRDIFGNDCIDYSNKRVPLFKLKIPVTKKEFEEFADRINEEYSTEMGYCPEYGDNPILEMYSALYNSSRRSYNAAAYKLEKQVGTMVHFPLR